MDQRVAICATSVAKDVAALLPPRYKVIGKTLEGQVIIAGVDHLGWTLDAYVIPRLGSGLIYCKEL